MQQAWSDHIFLQDSISDFAYNEKQRPVIKKKKPVYVVYKLHICMKATYNLKLDFCYNIWLRTK